jgi:hypothetical protein
MALANTQGVKISPADPADQAATDRARLTLGPAARRPGGVNGGWWPRSRDAAAELPALISELRAQTGRVRRIALQADAFVNIPHQLAAGGYKVHVGWFRHMNPLTAILTMADQDDLILLVVPPESSQAAAAETLRLAAAGRTDQQPAAMIADGLAVGDGQLTNSAMAMNWQVAAAQT